MIEALDRESKNAVQHRLVGFDAERHHVGTRHGKQLQATLRLRFNSVLRHWPMREVGDSQVTSVSAVFFDAAQRRRERPALTPDLRSRAFEALPEQYYQYLERQSFDPFLRSAPFARGRAEGLIGVPILNAEEMTAMLGEYEVCQDVDGQPAQRSWWEFWNPRTTNTRYCPVMPNPT